MRRLLIIIILCISAFAGADAQNFTQKLQQQKTEAEGVVKLHQSAEINKLVNGGSTTSTRKDVNTPEKTTEKTPQKATEKNTSIHQEEKTLPQHKNDSNRHESATASSHKEQNRQRAEERNQHEVQQDNNDSMEQPSVDTRKKVMRKSYKVTGYRVQAYAGGNTRAARQQAESIGNNIKMKYPDQPIYVHFYSPRWICRVGNYRSYEEAHAMLKNIRRMGYKQATIVKGKISVQY